MKYIFTDFYGDFECVGGKCIDTCCKDWKILIDQNTYEKYAALEEPLRSRICRHIEKWEQGGYKIILDSDGRCPFLNKHNLCDIYSMLSPDAMGNVCWTYPRITKQYYDVIMGTLTVSCPEVARIIIEKRTPIEFYFWEEQSEGDVEGADWTLYNELINGLVIAADILQDRNLLLWQRFQLILVETSIIQEHIEHQDFLSLRGSIECLREGEYRQGLYAGRQTNPLEKMGKWRFIYTLFEEVVSIRALSAGTVAVLNKFRAIAPDDEQTYQMWNREFNELDLDIEYENLAVQCMFEYYMDALQGKSLYINVVKMLVFLILVRTLEVVDGHVKKELTVEDRAFIIAKTSEAVEHSEMLELLAGALAENNERTMLFELISVFG